jgi:hypothetical protein
MATHDKKGASAEKPARAEEKRFPIVHAIVLGKGETRERRTSGHVTAGEVGGEATIEHLLKMGAIRDPDAPVRPSEASEERARGVVIDIALEGEVLTREGERYRLGDRLLDTEGLAAVSLSDLSGAVIAALKSRVTAA